VCKSGEVVELTSGDNTDHFVNKLESLISLIFNLDCMLNKIQQLFFNFTIILLASQVFYFFSQLSFSNCLFTQFQIKDLRFMVE